MRAATGRATEEDWARIRGLWNAEPVEKYLISGLLKAKGKKVEADALQMEQMTTETILAFFAKLDEEGRGTFLRAAEEINNLSLARLRSNNTLSPERQGRSRTRDASPSGPSRLQTTTAATSSGQPGPQISEGNTTHQIPRLSLDLGTVDIGASVLNQINRGSNGGDLGSREQ